jgi:hypothetical protein
MANLIYLAIASVDGYIEGEVGKFGCSTRPPASGRGSSETSTSAPSGS